jgi:hypothetical protein
MWRSSQLIWISILTTIIVLGYSFPARQVLLHLPTRHRIQDQIKSSKMSLAGAVSGNLFVCGVNPVEGDISLIRNLNDQVSSFSLD